MHSTPLFDSLIWTGALIQFAICAVVIYRKLQRQWASILVYCALSISFDIALAVSRHPYRRYFYLYWTWNLLAAILRLWVLSDVLASFPGAAFIRPKLRWSIAAFGVTIAAGAAFITARDGATYASSIVHTVAIVDRCVNIAWGVFFVIALLAIRLIGLGWQRTGALVANALTIKIVAAVIFSYLISFASPHGRVIGNYVLAFLSLGSFSLWLWALSTDCEESYNEHPSTAE